MFKKYDSRRQFVARRASNKTIKIIISDYDKSQEFIDDILSNWSGGWIGEVTQEQLLHRWSSVQFRPGGYQTSMS